METLLMMYEIFPHKNEKTRSKKSKFYVSGMKWHRVLKMSILNECFSTFNNKLSKDFYDLFVNGEMMDFIAKMTDNYAGEKRMFLDGLLKTKKK